MIVACEKKKKRLYPKITLCCILLLIDNSTCIGCPENQFILKKDVP